MLALFLSIAVNRRTRLFWLQVIWVCILCRKKQELLSKTGQWMAKTGLGAVDSALLRQMQEDLQVGGRQGLADQTRDKRPKLERAHSAAEKENLPLLQRSGNCPLRRQYSQQEQVTFSSLARYSCWNTLFYLQGRYTFAHVNVRMLLHS